MRDIDADAAFVASGTGITPMMAMAKEHARAGTGETHVFHGERSQGDLMCRETLDQLDAQSEGVHATYVLSGEEWNGPTGHVQDHLADRLGDLPAYDCYVCGVPERVVETTDLLAEAGVPDERVFTEGWERDAVADADG